MIKLTKAVETAIFTAAQDAMPSEMCGYVVKDGRKQHFYLAKNIAEHPQETFEIDADDWIEAEKIGEIVAVVHSHPNNEPYLSGADRQVHRQSGLTWLLVTNGQIKQFRACPHLRGRVFEYGKADCGTLVRDALMLAGLDFNDHQRTDIDKDAEAGYWQQHLIACGAKRVLEGLQDIQVGDVILTALGGHVHHAVFYLGNGEILHHAYNQLSRREPFNQFWQDCTHSVWRHPDWQPEMIEAIYHDLLHLEDVV